MLSPQSYAKKRTHASFRATNLQRESITKPIRLVDGIKEVFYTQSEGIGYLMQTLQWRIYAMVHILAYLLFRHTHKTSKFSVRYVFFINTSYSRNCDSNCSFCFILKLV